MSRRGRGDGAQAAVELVLVLPLVVVVALAALQVALVARDQVLVLHAAREAARQAAVAPDDAGAAVAAARGSTALEPGRVSVRTARGAGTVTATVGYRSPTELPVVGALVGDVALRASVTMRAER